VVNKKGDYTRKW